MDRKALGARVFGHPEELQFLENLIHPWVKQQASELRLAFAAEGHLFAVYDLPLLYEKQQEQNFDRVVVVGCSRAVQLERLMQRNGLTLAEAEVRLQSQLPLQEKIPKATDCLWNEGSVEALGLQVTQLIQKLRSFSAQLSKTSPKT